MNFTSTRQEKLKEFEHTQDWSIHYTRAVIKNSEWKFLWLYDMRFDHYQLPWWKVDAWEDFEVAISREVYEETGCRVNSIRHMWSKKLLCIIWIYISHQYEVEISWIPAITEPDKFSHCSRITAIDTEDGMLQYYLESDLGEKYKTVQQLTEWGIYEIIAYLQWNHYQLWDWDFPMKTPYIWKVDTFYSCYFDTIVTYVLMFF